MGRMPAEESPDVILIDRDGRARSRVAAALVRLGLAVATVPSRTAAAWRRTSAVAAVVLRDPRDRVLLAEIAASERPVIAVLPHEDLDEATRALDAGAAAVVTRDASGKALAGAVIAVGAGHTVVPEELVRRSGNGHRGPRRRGRDRRTQLRPEHRRLLWMLSSGWTVAALAERLGVSKRTLERRLSELYDTLGVRNRIEAVARAVDQQLFGVDAADEA